MRTGDRAYNITKARANKLSTSFKIKAKSLGYENEEEFKKYDYDTYVQWYEYIRNFSTKVIDEMNYKASNKYEVKVNFNKSQIRRFNGGALAPDRNRKEVIIEGVKYNSIKEANRMTGMSRNAIREHLKQKV